MVAPRHPEVAQAELAATAITDGLGALFRLACGVLRALEAQHPPSRAPLTPGAPRELGPVNPSWPSGGESLVALLEATRAPLRDLANVLIAASTMVEARWEMLQAASAGSGRPKAQP